MDSSSTAPGPAVGGADRLPSAADGGGAARPSTLSPAPSGAGINDNIELGTLIEVSALPGLLHRHIDLLIDSGTLEPVS